MRSNGIYTVHSCKHRPNPKLNEETRYRENILSRRFAADKPDQAWAGDITYNKTKAGWVYLAVVIDLFNKEVIGYWASKKPNTELVRMAMEQALFTRDYPRGVMFHSDRGCQYSSRRYLSFLEENEIESSMSRKGNPYDNACTESLFASLKKEWIFYNRKRMHRSLGLMSPQRYLELYKARKSA